MTTKEFFKNLFTGVLFAGAIYIFIMVFMYFIDNEVSPEEIFDIKMRIDYNETPEETPRHHLRHKERMRERLLTEASEFPERFTDREIINLLID
tara:strand:- start:332 stop:613 length:282 start_codon:yes stop_codon:yes gene_type:complete